jgi:hypothetical protein
VVHRCVWSRDCVNEEALAHWGLSRQKQTNKQKTHFLETVSVQIEFPDTASYMHIIDVFYNESINIFKHAYKKFTDTCQFSPAYLKYFFRGHYKTTG